MNLGRGRPGWPAEPPAEPQAGSYGSSWRWGSDSWPCSTRPDWLSYRHKETVQKEIWLLLFFNILRKHWCQKTGLLSVYSSVCLFFISPPSPHLFFSFIVKRFSKTNRKILEWRLFVPTFPGRAGWAVCRRWWRLQPRSSVSSSSPLGWRGGHWTAAESTFYLQTEPTELYLEKSWTYRLLDKWGLSTSASFRQLH